MTDNDENRRIKRTIAIEAGDFPKSICKKGENSAYDVRHYILLEVLSNCVNVQSD
jgi:hypothetical protein